MNTSGINFARQTVKILSKWTAIDKSQLKCLNGRYLFDFGMIFQDTCDCDRYGENEKK